MPIDKENQFLDLAALLRRWNPEKNTINNVTMSETNVGCVAFDNAPLQAAHLQPGHDVKIRNQKGANDVPLLIGV
jgi:hypothetical protein